MTPSLIVVQAATSSKSHGIKLRPHLVKLYRIGYVGSGLVFHEWLIRVYVLLGWPQIYLVLATIR